MLRKRARLALFGTFDIPNFGDLLFPLIFKHEICRRMPEASVTLFSYAERKRRDWYFDVEELSSFSAQAHSYEAIVIGGGHLIRFDKTVAPGYFPAHPELHHPTSYWLNPALLGISVGVPVAWSAVGASSEIPLWGRELLAAALRGSDYVSVRDELSLSALSSIAPDVAIQVVPDTAFGISKLLSSQQQSKQFREYRHKYSISKKYIVVQTAPGLRSHLTHLQRVVERYRRSGYDIVLLPVSVVLGDSLSALGFECGACRGGEDWPHPLVSCEIIAHASAVVGISLHLSIVALAFGVPVIRPKTSDLDKYTFLNRMEGVYSLAECGVGGCDLAAVRGGEHKVSAQVDAVQRRLDEHWDTISRLITTGGDRKHKTSVLRALMTRMAFLCEELRTEADGELHHARELAQQRQASIQGLEEKLAQWTAESGQCRAHIAELEGQLRQAHEQAQQRQAWIQELEEKLAHWTAEADKRQVYIGELQGQLRQAHEQAQGRQAWIQELEEKLAHWTAEADKRQAYIGELEGQLHEAHELAQQRQAWIQELEERLAHWTTEADRRGAYIEELERVVAQRDSFIDTLQGQLRDRDRWITEARSTLAWKLYEKWMTVRKRVGRP